MKYFLIFFVLVLLLTNFSRAQSDFETNSLLIKASVKQSGLETKTITISSKTSGEFFLKIESLKGVNVEEERFSLNGGEEKVVEINFDSRDIEPGIYIGSLEVRSPEDSMKIPIIFEIDANIDIPPAYKEVEQGSKLTYQIKIFDLSASGGLQEGLSAVNVEVNYIVYSLGGKVAITKDEQLVVDKQSQLTSAIGFPKDMEIGTYVLGAVVKYKGSVGIATQTFEIKKAEVKASENIFSNYFLIAAVIFALVVFIGTVALLVYLLRERDKILYELRRFNEQETKMVFELLKEQKEVAKNKKRGLGKNLDKEIEEKLQELRKKQETRIDEIEKLKKAGNVKEMQKKLDFWRKKGYDTRVMDYKIAGLTTSEMKQLLQKWKKKYSKQGKPKN